MKKQKSLIALLICLAFCLISMFGTWSMLTCNGTVEVNDLKISTSKGDLVRFLEYRPKTATADNPVPAIVYSPGNDSTAESVRLCSSELACRGYAVYVLDLLSAGHSSEGIGNSPTFGFEELIDYVYSNLDYVDNAHIGIAGYSKGGGNVIRVMTTLGDQQREDPDNYVRKVDAALILAPASGCSGYRRQPWFWCWPVRSLFSHRFQTSRRLLARRPERKTRNEGNH